MNPATNEKIMGPALLEMMQFTLSDAARNKILRGGGGPPKPNILTSRTGTLRRSLGAAFNILTNMLPRSIEGGTHLIYGAVHEATQRAFLAPALADSLGKFEDIVIKHWQRQQ